MSDYIDDGWDAISRLQEEIKALESRKAIAEKLQVKLIADLLRAGVMPAGIECLLRAKTAAEVEQIIGDAAAKART